jgi:hypothetical protein
VTELDTILKSLSEEDLVDFLDEYDIWSWHPGMG